MTFLGAEIGYASTVYGGYLDGNAINIQAKPFGANPNGTTDATTAITDAITEGLATQQAVFVPPGNYKTTSDIAIDIGSGNNSTGPVLCFPLLGVPGKSTILPSSAVNTCLSVLSHTNTDQTTNRFIMNGVRIDGVNGKAGLVGLDFGNSSGNVYGRYHLSEVEVLRCTGSGGTGLIVRNVVDLLGLNCYFSQSETNLTLNGVGLATTPTTVVFYKSSFREATDRGVVLTQAFGTTFRDCLFESNTHEGLYCVPTGGTSVLRTVVDGCWFEANWPSDATKYQLNIDATASGVLELTCRDTQFYGSTRSFYGKSVSSLILDNPFPRATANSVVIDTGCFGTIQNWPEARIAYATAVTNNSSATMAKFSANTPAIVTSLGVANSASGSTLGTVIGKYEIFSAAGVSLGFAPIYDHIT